MLRIPRVPIVHLVLPGNGAGTVSRVLRSRQQYDSSAMTINRSRNRYALAAHGMACQSGQEEPGALSVLVEFGAEFAPQPGFLFLRFD